MKSRTTLLNTDMIIKAILPSFYIVLYNALLGTL